MESSSLQELEQIPGVGKTIAQDMQNIGIHSIDALKGRQAEQLYAKGGIPLSFRAKRSAAEESIKTKAGLAGLKWLYTKYYRLSTKQTLSC